MQIFEFLYTKITNGGCTPYIYEKFMSWWVYELMSLWAYEFMSWWVCELVSWCVCEVASICELMSLSDHEFANSQVPQLYAYDHAHSNNKEKRCKEHSLHLFNIVAETRLEHVTSRLWAWRATNCSTPRCLFAPHFRIASAKVHIYPETHKLSANFLAKKNEFVNEKASFFAKQRP